MAKIKQKKPTNFGKDDLPLKHHQVNDDGTDMAYCMIDNERYDLPGAYDSEASHQTYLLLCKLIKSQDIEIYRIEVDKAWKQRQHVNEIIKREETRFEYGSFIFTHTLVIESLRRRDSAQVRREQAAALREQEAENESQRQTLWHFFSAPKYYAPARWLARRHGIDDFTLPSDSIRDPTQWLENLLSRLASLVYPKFESFEPERIKMAKRRALRLLVELMVRKRFEMVDSSVQGFNDAVDWLVSENKEAFGVIRDVQPLFADDSLSMKA